MKRASRMTREEAVAEIVAMHEHPRGSPPGWLSHRQSRRMVRLTERVEELDGALWTPPWVARDALIVDEPDPGPAPVGDWGLPESEMIRAARARDTDWLRDAIGRYVTVYGSAEPPRILDPERNVIGHIDAVRHTPDGHIEMSGHIDDPHLGEQLRGPMASVSIDPANEHVAFVRSRTPAELAEIADRCAERIRKLFAENNRPESPNDFALFNEALDAPLRMVSFSPFPFETAEQMTAAMLRAAQLQRKRAADVRPDPERLCMQTTNPLAFGDIGTWVYRFCPEPATCIVHADGATFELCANHARIKAEAEAIRLSVLWAVRDRLRRQARPARLTDPVC